MSVNGKKWKKVLIIDEKPKVHYKTYSFSKFLKLANTFLGNDFKAFDDKSLAKRVVSYNKKARET